MPIKQQHSKSPTEIIDLRSLPQFRPIRDNAFIDTLRKAVAFDYVSVTGLDVEGHRLGDRIFHIESDVPPAVVEVYLADRLYEDDPLLRHVRETQCIALESVVYPKHGVPQRFVDLADSFSIRNRTVFPVKRGSSAVASVCFMRQEPFTDEEVAFLRQVTPAVYNAVVGSLVKRFAAEGARLTEGELTCLRLAADGLTTSEIAKNSKFQAVTVDSYIKNATKKLGCRNRTHAIAEAIRRQLI